MIQGKLVDSRPYAIIPIRWGNKVQEILALIDTGFDGDIRVSPEQANDLGLILDHVERFQFANGSQKDIPASVAYSEINGVINSLDIAILQGTPMIGMGFLKKFQTILTINLKQSSVELA